MPVRNLTNDTKTNVALALDLKQRHIDYLHSVNQHQLERMVQNLRHHPKSPSLERRFISDPCVFSQSG
jgi:hypothetical protein